MAVRTRDGGVWRTTRARLDEPVRQAVWDYNVAVARAAARAGFDEIQFDYVGSRATAPSTAPSPGCEGPAGLDDRPLRPLRGQAVTAREGARVGRRSGSRRRATSASASSRAAWPSSSTPSIRWSTRRTTTRASTASTARSECPARPSPGRWPTSEADARDEGAADPLARGLLVQRSGLARPRARADHGRAPAGRERLPALEPLGVYTAEVFRPAASSRRRRSASGRRSSTPAARRGRGRRRRCPPARPSARPASARGRP